MAQLVVVGCLAVWLLAVLSPRLPKRVVLPPALFILWWALGASPLGLFVSSQGARAAVALAGQGLLTVLAFALVRRRDGRWWLQPDRPPRPLFRARHTLVLAALHLLLAPPLLAAYVGLSVAESLVRSTDRFVRFDGKGMQTAERRYQRGNREVVLVGMVHIGEPDGYRDLYASFVQPGTVVLQEGVSDREGRLEVALSYEPMAAAMGLGTQPELETVLRELRDEGQAPGEGWPRVWPADLDASAFSQDTIELVSGVARVMDAEDPGAELRRFGERLRAGGPAMWRRVEQDLLVLRNAHVARELDRALGEGYRRVVVPWGALHMPGLEREVLARGFEPVDERLRLAFRYGTIWEGLRAAVAAARR